jgi:hypothetical protein
LIVFASEKNRTNLTGRLHTNFRLANDGEFPRAGAPGQTIASQFAPAYPKQSTDVSYGRVEGAADTTGYFVKPTPGGINTSGGSGFGPELQFSHGSGTFTEPFDLTLASGTPNVAIRYTLDGNLPTDASTIYASPIRITNSVQVRARAFAEGCCRASPGEALLLSNNVVNFVSGLCPSWSSTPWGEPRWSSSRQTFTHISVYDQSRVGAAD